MTTKLKPNDMPNIETVKRELAKYGIYTESDLDNHMATMERLNITCMVSPIKKEKIIKEC